MAIILANHAGQHLHLYRELWFRIMVLSAEINFKLLCFPLAPNSLKIHLTLCYENRI